MRTYKPRPPKYRRGRMLRAARLRGEGLSLRRIAAELSTSYETVRRDLAAWDAEQATVSHLPVTKVTPGGHGIDTPRDSEDARILPMRRTS